MLIPLAPKVWVVAPEVPPRYPYGNCMYIEADYPTLIDLGAGGLAFSALNQDKVRKAVLSHFHFDHIHGQPFFPQAELSVLLNKSLILMRGIYSFPWLRSVG